MRHLAFIMTIPLAVLAVSFAVSNRGPVTLALWPLEQRLEAPVYLAVLLPAGLAFLLGGTVAWLAAAHVRRQLRRQRAEAEALAAELRRLRERRTDAAAPSLASPR